ncbi:MAG: aldose 1-epimerase family protein, partial [Oscillospiraceae bacterium]|nr:aldose 1-epimerase family protein [Oscillospiraceae bacterium]
MEYIIENEYLKLTVTTWGAQVKSVVRKCDGVEHIWQADPAVWGFHTPILFPHAGKVVDGIIEAKGGVYESGQHGFARLMEHDFVDQTDDTIVLELCSSPETLAKFPYEFRLVSTFTLEGDTLHHTLTVENLDTDKLPFGIGYHPGFTVPFDDKHQATDYELRFSDMESPLCLNCLPTGLIQDDHYYLGSNIRSIPIDEKLFANDSHC